jgi:hypothetical protein
LPSPRGRGDMFSLIMMWCGNALQGIILYRAFRANILKTYPFFYAYITSSLISFFALSIVYLTNFGSYFGLYAKWYWPIQFATLILGCGIALEILTHVLSSYPGAERFATVSGIVAFGGAFCLALILSFVLPAWSAAGTMVELERNLRLVQAIVLFGILAVISYYRIPVGRNMKGMVLGYGIYVGTSLFALAVRAYAGAWLQNVLVFAQPISFMISLSIWVVTLWSYHPNPAPESIISLETDYEAFVAKTRSAMGAMRSHLARAGRS